ncbi:hypothetical protein PWT90_10397 [Aphanocladium album]|nr:hypothetical protein PWT90_10397 [Aphanocladium album]
MEFGSDLDSDSSELDSRVYSLLGTATLEAFARFTPAKRKEILRRSQVQRKPVIIDEGDDDGSLNPGTADGIILRIEYFMGTSDVAKQIIKEARELYYGENHFVVHLHWLCEFIVDRIQNDDIRVDVPPLVGAITVEVDLHDGNNEHHIYTAPKPDERSDPFGMSERCGQGKLARWTQEELRTLLRFTSAKEVVVMLRGGGMLDGSDLATQQTVRDIAAVVKELTTQFGDKLKVFKRIDRQSRPFGEQSIRSYWDAPTTVVLENVRRGQGTFKEIMQVQIWEWTLVIPAGDPKNLRGRDRLI